MKKTILAGAIAAACFTITACDSNKSDAVAQGADVLAYVPAQTALFFGQFEPAPTKKTLESYAVQFQGPSMDAAIAELKQEAQAATGGERFATELLIETVENLKDPDAFIKSLGLPDEGRSYFYTVGALPVMKMEVKDANAFWAFFDKAEKTSAYTHTMKKINDVEYRNYNIVKDEDGTSLDVAILVKDGMATIALDAGADNSLAVALGLEKPNQSLAESGKIEALVKEFKLSGEGVGFINHVALIEALTKKDSNRLGKQIAMLASKAQDPSFNAMLEMMQTEQCASEFNGIAKNWPQTIFGFDYQVDGDKVAANTTMVIDSKNKAMVDALGKIQGYVPAYVTEPNALSLGLGLDVGNLASGANGVLKELVSPQFKCPILATMQSDIATTDTSALGMAGMLSGLKGISFGLFDYDVTVNSWGDPEQFTLDGLFAISAEDPMALYNTIAGFQPMIQMMIPISEDGKATNLSEAMPDLRSTISNDIYVALKGHHIVFYAGDKGEKTADALSKEKVDQNNAFMGVGMDYDALLAPAIKAVKAQGQELPDELQMLEAYKYKGSADLKITERGIEMDTKAQY
ncbi:hypothetical protein VST7929_02999 [Vibrio stylophorae]|uniref:DUF4836 family protein n=1 Tax=Vibrio stylophorae TaxID=659351 RepID=A0ABN8DW51_9VIBR|nr:hypothetical protein [Vibrio stylophorae]CAH0535426.1 hypothetical protein VST7929_02999 [Vibrio stylophorae]